MRETFVVVFLVTTVLASLALAQSTTPKTTKKTTTTKATAKKGKASSKTVRRVPAVVRQGTPTPERYKEIQQALADKGYLKSEPNGVWDAESSAALAQFQNDRKMMPTGKLTAASLIALGLGPATAPVPPDAAAHPAPAPASPN
jgi:hypothetical protein